MTERDLEARIAVLSDALKSISKNTCCDNCQEAARVARSALGAYVGLARDHSGDDAQGSLDIPPERHRTDEQRADIQRAWDLIGNNDEIILNSTDGHLAVLRAIQLGRALAAQPPAAPVETKRKTFTIPPGHEAVRRLRSSSVPSHQSNTGE